MDYGEEWWQYTPLSQSNIHGERCDLIPSIQTQTSEHECIDLMGNNNWP